MTNRARSLRVAVAAIAVVQLLIGGLLAMRAIAEPSGFEADSRGRQLADTPLTVESGYLAAQQIAADWSSESRLFAVQMQVDWPLTVDPQSPIALAPGGWLTYTFVRADEDGDAEQMLSLFYERTSGVLVRQDVVDWPDGQEILTIDPQGRGISSEAAILAVEAREGRSWRAACPASRHLTRISLTANAGAAPTWVVTYADSVTDRAGIRAHIDAERGQITRLDVRSDSCQAA